MEVASVVSCWIGVWSSLAIPVEWVAVIKINQHLSLKIMEEPFCCRYVDMLML
jgi:hypothetical protein